jgi:hypothetical protein
VFSTLLTVPVRRQLNRRETQARLGKGELRLPLPFLFLTPLLLLMDLWRVERGLIEAGQVRLPVSRSSHARWPPRFPQSTSPTSSVDKVLSHL